MYETLKLNSQQLSRKSISSQYFPINNFITKLKKEKWFFFHKKNGMNAKFHKAKSTETSFFFHFVDESKAFRFESTSELQSQQIDVSENRVREGTRTYLHMLCIEA